MTTEEKKTIIVDEHDNVIGYKYREEIDHTKDIYRVSALWVENSHSDILIAQRKWNKDKDPGKWGPAVAGTVEEGETYDSNIYKESEEEIGLTGQELIFAAKYKKEGPRIYFAQLYKVVVDWPLEKFTIQEDEVEQIQWIPRSKLVENLKNNPDNYVSSMGQIMSLV